MILTVRHFEASAHFHFRLLISSEGPGNLETENRVISTWHTIYRTEAVWKARSCRCLPHLRTPCRHAWGSPPAKWHPPPSAWRHGAPSWLGGPAGALTDRLHLTQSEENIRGNQRKSCNSFCANIIFIQPKFFNNLRRLRYNNFNYHRVKRYEKMITFGTMDH